MFRSVLIALMYDDFSGDNKSFVNPFWRQELLLNLERYQINIRAFCIGCCEKDIFIVCVRVCERVRTCACVCVREREFVCLSVRLSIFVYQSVCLFICRILYVRP